MGRRPEILLVRRRTLIGGLAASLALGVGAARAGTVAVDDYDAFWLWAGVTPQPVLAHAKSLYLLQAEVDAGPRGAHLVAQGGATPHLRHGELWMVYRVHTLDWSAHLYAQVAGRLARWRAAGNCAVGVQIDFDARTRHLDQYGDFLRNLRRQLPADCRLSITGLLDWSTQGDPAALSALSGVIDEVVLQTYQGRTTIPNYAIYVDRIGRVKLPFKLGLVQGGDWTAPSGLAANPWFLGYVVFLRNGVEAPAGETSFRP
jgi:hypothetical protein